MESIPQRLHTDCNGVLIEPQLHRSLKYNDFYLVMQPIVRLDAVDECLEGECLGLLAAPTAGRHFTRHFIPIAEKRPYYRSGPLDYRKRMP